MQSMGSQSVRDDLETEQQQLTSGIYVSYGSSIFNFLRNFCSGLNNDFYYYGTQITKELMLLNRGVGEDF